LTSDPTEIPLLRIRLDPESGSGLVQPSNIMVDKLTTMPRSKLGQYIGRVADTDMLACRVPWWCSSVSPDSEDVGESPLRSS
jgi:mRNA-degrading endonuclease toxin of MazEF toxin-antitoxin module